MRKERGEREREKEKKKREATITFLITGKREARWNISFRRFQLQSGCDSIAISTRGERQRRFRHLATPLFSAMSRRGGASSQEEEETTTYLASRISGTDVSVDSFSRLMYSRDAARLFHAENSTRISVWPRYFQRLASRKKSWQKCTAGEDISRSSHERVGETNDFLFPHRDISNREGYLSHFLYNNSLCKRSCKSTGENKCTIGNNAWLRGGVWFVIGRVRSPDSHPIHNLPFIRLILTWQRSLAIMLLRLSLARNLVSTTGRSVIIKCVCTRVSEVRV